MKKENRLRALKILSIVFLLASASFLFSGCDATAYLDNNNSYQAPRGYDMDDLNQYGQWIDIPTYGHVWQPSVVEGWEPFYNGHWINSDNNWTWVSYEPFGWIVYHYGYWFDSPEWGWVWIPGNTGWSPATVQWRQYDDYVSWAPLLPPGVSYKEPWDERNVRYWHTVKSNSFLKENVGRLQEAHPVYRNNNDQGKNNPQQPQNQQPAANRTNPLDRLKQAPNQRDIENRTGQKVNNTPVKQNPVQTKTNTNTFRKMDLPEGEKKKVENYQQNVKKEVIVPRQEKKKDVKKEDKKEDKR